MLGLPESAAEAFVCCFGLEWCAPIPHRPGATHSSGLLSIVFAEHRSTALGGSGALRIPRVIKSTNKVVKIALEKVTPGVVCSKGGGTYGWYMSSFGRLEG